MIIADTKFEFGLAPRRHAGADGRVLTPDSSRYWPVEGYEAPWPLAPTPSYDKQFVRDWLEQAKVNGKPGTKPPRATPARSDRKTAAKYREALERPTHPTSFN